MTPAIQCPMSQGHDDAAAAGNRGATGRPGCITRAAGAHQKSPGSSGCTICVLQCGRDIQLRPAGRRGSAARQVVWRSYPVSQSMLLRLGRTSCTTLCMVSLSFTAVLPPVSPHKLPKWHTGMHRRNLLSFSYQASTGGGSGGHGQDGAGVGVTTGPQIRAMRMSGIAICSQGAVSSGHMHAPAISSCWPPTSCAPVELMCSQQRRFPERFCELTQSP